MVKLRVVVALAATLSVCGCVTETAQFQPGVGQQALVRDGQPAIVSQKAKSLIIMQPALPEFQAGQRPAYVVGIYNLSNAPINFAMANVHVTQTLADGTAKQLKVITYAQLVKEERDRQIAAAILVGLAAGANAYSASQAGYYHSNSTVYSPYGVATVHTTGYSPAAAAIAQANASAQNSAMIGNTIEQGRRNLAVLQQSAIKDDTLLPGEWYGGRLQFEPPVRGSGKTPEKYRITIAIGDEVHSFDVLQGKAVGS
jgi:hypothetical protein